MTSLIAHSKLLPDGKLSVEPLFEHLDATRKLAKSFAEKFDSGVFAEIVAKFHDLGKASAEFQRYIAQSTPAAAGTHGSDHSSAGAQFLDKSVPQGLGTLLAYAVAGHHAGLPDGICPGESSLVQRLAKKIPDWEKFAADGLPENFLDPEMLKREIAAAAKPFRKFCANGFSSAFWVRMLFSCLVDADFLATENFMAPEKSRSREAVSALSIPQLFDRLEKFVELKFAETDSPLAKIREEIRADCLAAAELPPGIFTLTVPTGGGKTLSSLAFALKHAKTHAMSRVIYAIPFTSIIEQNAKVFRDALGGDSVLEHHSNIETSDSEKCDAQAEEDCGRSRLAAENWDAPVVVTTNVQFFESLFANKPSRCRKLHNIAKSVIILDEAQTLPIPLLKPCLRALDELVCNYGASIVLCTATQPSVSDEKLKDGGLRGNAHGIREIIKPGRALYERLRRTKVEKLDGKFDDAAIAEKLARERRVLAIVNTRSAAKNLFLKLRESVPADERAAVFHLSAQMCAVHRLEVLEKIRKNLRENLPCRVVSTQLIEAGVDIDFPCVYRALTGIDSIAQAAGRCNREGKIGGNGGHVFVFEPEDFPLPQFLRSAAEKGKEVLDLPEFGNDPISLASVEKYFGLMFFENRAAMDEKGVIGTLIPKKRCRDREDCFGFRFRALGEKFHLIEEAGEPIIVPYGEKGNELCEKLRESYDPASQKQIVRALQRYTVNIPEKNFRKSVDAGTVKILHERYAILESVRTNYDGDLGVNLDDGGNDTLLNI